VGIARPLLSYLDECVDTLVTSGLDQRGYDTLDAERAGMRQRTDAEQLAFAVTQQRVLLTHNGRHFLVLHRQYLLDGRVHHGIIHLPENSRLPRPSRVTQLTIRAALMLDWLGTWPDPRSQFLKWGDLQRHLTQGYRPPGWSEAEIRLALGQTGRSP